MRKLLLLPLLVLALTGCGEWLYVQYDAGVASCEVSNGRYRIEVQVDRDSTYTKGDVQIPDEFTRACEELKAADTWVGP